MGVLDAKVLPGQPVTVNAEYHNELVDKLIDRGKQQTLRAAASTSKVLVSHVDDSILPAAVVISDETDWRGLTRDQLYIAASVTGGGELASSTLDPGGNTTWTWDDVTWDAAELPASVTVTLTPFFLTAATTGDSVATVGDLPGSATANDRLVVRADRKVYKYNGASWSEDAGVGWVAGTGATLNFVAEQSFDPNYKSEQSLQLFPEADYLRMTQGAVDLAVHDFSAFPSTVTSVARTVVAEYVAPDGSITATETTEEAEESEEDAVLPVVNMIGADLEDWLAASDRSFSVQTTQPGVLLLTATYNIDAGASTVVVKRRIRIGTPERGRYRADDIPSVPSFKLTPGNGECSVRLGTHVTVDTVTDEGWTEVEPAIPPTNVLIQNIAARLAITGSSDPDADRALAAAETFRSVFATGIGGKLKTYALTLKAGTGITEADLKTTTVGQMLYLPSGALKVASVGTMTSNDDSERVLPITAIGLYEGLLTEEGEDNAMETGWISSNADLIASRLEFAYGTPTEEDFPLQSFTQDRLFTPLVRLPEFSVVLPTAQPTRLSDAWYVTGEVDAFWVSGDIKSANVTDGYVRVEELVTGEPTLTVERDDDIFSITVTGPYDFYGKGFFTDSTTLVGTAPTAADALAATAAFEPKLKTVLSRDFHSTPKVYVVEGHLRTRGGSCGVQIHRAISTEAYTPSGAPVVTSDAAPEGSAPATNGVFHTDGTDYWVSLDSNWVKLTPVADDHYVKSELYTQTEADDLFAAKADHYSKTEIDEAHYTKSQTMQMVSAAESTDEVTGTHHLHIMFEGKAYKLLAAELVTPEE